MKTPVAFLVFNRPEWTARVFEEIRKARPRRLLIVADGPRRGHPGDMEQCEKVRAILEQVDWDCEVRRNFADENLGCGKRVSSGLEWVFTEEEEAIILEDDCVPDQTFFPFCEELLERYRGDERIGQIGGVNYQFGQRTVKHSYYYSRFPFVWGWASWRRAWKGYDFKIALWPEIRRKPWLKDLFASPGTIRYYTYSLDKTYQGGIDTWDYQWFFHCWVNHRLTILPKVNLVSNIGYQPMIATHTNFRSPLADVSTEPLSFPLDHPPFMMRDPIADRFNEAQIRYGLFSLVNLLSTKHRFQDKVKSCLLGRDPGRRIL